jgi:lysophospholipase L1-like esterase
MKPIKPRLPLSIFILPILSLILLVMGFGMAIKEIVQSVPVDHAPPPDTTTSPTIPREKVLIGLGDSLTRGIGDDSGQGYFGILKKSLQKRFTSLQAVNLAVSGATSLQLAQQVDQKQVQELLKKADWVTITIGGNDLFYGSGQWEKIDEETAETYRLAYVKNLRHILSVIRQQNQTATVFIFGLYNPFSDLPEEKRSSRLVIKWNDTIQKTASDFHQVVMVPIFDLFQQHPKKYLYSDHFHPNALGYQRMAERLLQGLLRLPVTIQAYQE